MIEKPFGHDLESANELDAVVSEVFPPDSVFRIDHYLGKETVQNLLALRFANQLFEPIWNSQYIDHVQITMAEDIGIGSRAGYFDGIGTARDVIQNHLLQLFALTAMEEPASFDAADLRAEKEKVLRSGAAARRPGCGHRSRPVRGRMARRRAGWRLPRRGRHLADSITETYAAIRLDVPNRRWAGTPFYLRAGKRLGRRVTEIALVFKKVPMPYFQQIEGSDVGANALVIRVQPDEGVTLKFGSKVPGTTMEVRDVTMDFAYGNAFTESSPEAYERLILDVLLGDPPLFPRHEEVALSWEILDPITGVLGDAGPAGAVPLRHLGPGGLGRDACPRRPRLEATMIIELPNTTTVEINNPRRLSQGGRRRHPWPRHDARHRRHRSRRRGRDRHGERRLARTPVPHHRHRARRRAARRGSTPRFAWAATPALPRSSCCAPPASR